MIRSGLAGALIQDRLANAEKARHRARARAAHRERAGRERARQTEASKLIVLPETATVKTATPEMSEQTTAGSRSDLVGSAQ